MPTWSGRSRGRRVAGGGDRLPGQRPRRVRAGRRPLRPRHDRSTATSSGTRWSSTRSPAWSTWPASSTPGSRCSKPLLTYQQNVTGTAVLLEQMQAAGVDQIVFSSSAATYGTPGRRPRHRGHAHPARVPVRGEQADRGVAAGRPGPGGRAAAHLAALLQRGRLGDRRSSTTPARTTSSRWCWACSPRAGRRRSTATTTRPRTAPASATTSTSPTSPHSHLAAARALEAGRPLEPVYNLGSGDGVSVREIMTTIAEVTGIDFEPTDRAAADRRPGPDRRLRRAGRARPGLADAAQPARHGGQRLGGPAARRETRARVNSVSAAT